jgi:hypothetical protein
MVASKSANAPLGASEPYRDQMRPPSCYARRVATISAGVCCDWKEGDGQGVDIRTSFVVGCCRGEAAKLTSVIIYLPPSARGGARARSRTTTSGKQRPCMRVELIESLEDGLIVHYEVGVISISLAFYSLISEVRPETTFSINTTITYESAMHRSTMISDSRVRYSSSSISYTIPPAISNFLRSIAEDSTT